MDAKPVLLNWPTGDVKEVTLESLNKYGQSIRGLQFDRNGERLAGYTNNVVMIWNPLSGKLLGIISERSAIRGLLWNPEGESLLTVTAQGVRVWEMRSLQPELAMSNAGGRWVSISNDGKLIAASGKTVKVVVADIATGQTVFSLPGNTNGTHDAAFGPGDDLLASSGASWTDEAMRNLGGDVRLWSLDSSGQANMTRQIEFGGLVTQVVISRDGKRMAFSAMGQAGPAAPDPGTKLDFSERVVLVDLEEQSTLATIATERQNHIAFSPNGKLLIVAAGDSVKLYDAGTGKPIEILIEMFTNESETPLRPSGVDFLKNEQHLVVYYGTKVCINDIATGKILSRIHVPIDNVIGPNKVKILPDGSRVFVGCSDGVIRVFSPELGKIFLELRGHTSSVTHLEITPDGHKLVSTSYDHTVRVWDGSPLVRRDTGPIETQERSDLGVERSSQFAASDDGAPTEQIAQTRSVDEPPRNTPATAAPGTETSLATQSAALTEALQPGPSYPGLLAYEGFANGDDGAELLGLKTGQGFEGVWSLGGANPIPDPTYRIARGSLQYPDLSTSGNRVTASVTPSGQSRVRATLGQPWWAGRPWYLSFLVRPESQETDRRGLPYFGIELASAPAQPEMFVGRSTRGNRDRYCLYTNGQAPSDLEVKVGQTSLLVLKVEYPPGKCHVTLFTNPIPGEREPSNKFYADFRLSRISDVILVSNQPYSIDELRVGNSFESVTPSMSGVSSSHSVVEEERQRTDAIDETKRDSDQMQVIDPEAEIRRRLSAARILRPFNLRPTGNNPLESDIGLDDSVLHAIESAQGAVSAVGAFVISLPIEDVREISSKMEQAELMIQSMRPYLVDDQVLLAATWEPSEKEVRYKHGMIRSEVLDAHSAMREEGFRIADLGGYLTSQHVPDSERFYAVWRKAENQVGEQKLNIGLTKGETQSSYSQLKNSYQPLSRSLYFDRENEIRFCEVWESKVGSPESKWSIYWSKTANLDAQLRKVQNIPIRYIDLATSLEGKQEWFAAVWRDYPPTAQTRAIHDIPVADLSTVGKVLLANGYQPKSICVSGRERKQLKTASVWLSP